jgi:nucleotide-binding universal stress UspA family protein
MALQIMIPLDGSQFAEQAITYATDLAANIHATIHLVKVHQPIDDELLGDARFITSLQIDKRLHDDDRRYLARVANIAELSALNPVTALLNGNVVGALEKYIYSSGIDLVVMSTHGRGGLSRAWYGSVADELIRSANVPVLLLRPEGGPVVDGTASGRFHNILLPVDGSEFSEGLIQTAVAIGARENTHYTLLQVIVPAPPTAIADGIGMITGPDLSAEVQAYAAEHLAVLATALRARGHSVALEVVVHPDVSAAILAHAAEHAVDLIAMVTHGRGGWKRLALGSVSDTIMRATTVPILMLHPDDPGMHNPLAKDLHISDERLTFLA